MTKQAVLLPVIYPVTCHTDHVGPGSTFVAIQGAKLDGAQYITEALAKGASRIVVQYDAYVSDELIHHIHSAGARLMYVENARLALAELSARVLGYPSNKLKIIGITGTKGKTSSVFLLEHIMRSAGKKTALLSTVHNKIGDVIEQASLTTPQPDYLHMFFAECVRQDVEYVVMEVAAQALSLHRVAGIQFDAVSFINLSLEHSEFYASMEEYFEAKSELFTLVKAGGIRVLNADDVWCIRLKDRYLEAFLFSMHDATPADVHMTVLSPAQENLWCQVTTSYEQFDVACAQLMGLFNALNLAGVITIALQLGVSVVDIQKSMISFAGVPGRLNRYDLPNGALCFIDYAHNPSSYQAVLSLLRTLTHDLIVVCGAGGERGHERRPLMGIELGKYADKVVLTSDNPRSEDPSVIIEHLAAGMGLENQHKIVRELDRRLAIEKAYELSSAGSVIVILGKGPDEYQQIGNVKYYFSDREVVLSLNDYLVDHHLAVRQNEGG